MDAQMEEGFISLSVTYYEQPKQQSREQCIFTEQQSSSSSVQIEGMNVSFSRRPFFELLLLKHLSVVGVAASLNWPRRLWSIYCCLTGQAAYKQILFVSF